jgi:hypothetical protein
MALSIGGGEKAVENSSIGALIAGWKLNLLC